MRRFWTLLAHSVMENPGLKINLELRMIHDFRLKLETVSSRSLVFLALYRDGVPVLKVSDNSLPSMATRPPFLSTLAMGAEQQAKLALGQAKSLICIYESYQGMVF